jgi:hypothetical protein
VLAAVNPLVAAIDLSVDGTLDLLYASCFGCCGREMVAGDKL